MRLKTPLFLSIGFLMFLQPVFADSPITSTLFSKAYQHEKIVVEAFHNEGLLTENLMVYLADYDNPVAVKMALINQLGWDFKGKKNADIFLQYLKAKKGYTSKEDFLKKGLAHELLSMAYLMALDDYHNVDLAVKFVKKALASKPESYTFNIISALIHAQQIFNDSWCKVYWETHHVRLNHSLDMDMNKKAIEIIFDYMDIYKEYCK